MSMGREDFFFLAIQENKFNYIKVKWKRQNPIVGEMCKTYHAGSISTQNI